MTASLIICDRISASAGHQLLAHDLPGCALALFLRLQIDVRRYITKSLFCILITRTFF